MGIHPLKILKLAIRDIQPNSELEAEDKVTLPYLKTVKGYVTDNEVHLRIRVSKNVHVGGRFERIAPDIAIYISSEPFMIVESKPINRTIEIGDVNEAVSNARLYELPKQFPFSLVSTGLNWELYDSNSGVYIGDYQSVPDIQRAKALIKSGFPLVPEAKAEEAQRFIEARKLIQDRQKLYEVFKECKTRIEAEGKHGQEALSEISKIILAKIYEEQYHVKENRVYRFSLEFIDQQKAAYTEKKETDILNEIFAKANQEYKGNRPQGIFSPESKIELSNGTVRRIVELLEKPAFYGGGEDIKGAVYETFLKTVFRGDFGQYFTPREVVRFMVHLVEPRVGEKIIDPACGSGGFLIHYFIEVHKKILGMFSNGLIDEAEKKRKEAQLLNEHIWGVDIAETLVRFCKVNLIIQGDGYQNIFQADALNKNEGPLKDLSEQFQLILTNPPFDLPSEHLDHIIGDYYLYKEYGYEGADVLFLERCYELLAPGGRLAMIVPHRFIDGTAFENLRKWILDRMIPRAIINLPVGIFKPFGGSNARTSVLYLHKFKEEKEKQGHCLMATVKHVGFEPGTQQYRPDPSKNDLETIATSQYFYDLKAEEEKIRGLH